MNIIINNEKIDFTLEHEKILKDVLNSIEEWLTKSKMTITRVKLNGQYIQPLDLSKEGTRNVKTIETLEFSACPITTFRSEEIQSLLQYLINLKNSVLSKDKGQLKILLPLYPDARDSLYQYFTPKDSKGNESIIDTISKHLEGSTVDMINLLDEQYKSDVENAIDLVCGALIDISNRVSQKKQELSLDFLEELKPTVARLNGIPILLQTGKDSQAMESLALFSEAAQKFLSMVSESFSNKKVQIQIEGQSFEEFSRSLNELLRELITAFDKKDYILIGDLCEYEIAPRIEKLITSVQKELTA